MDELHSTVLQVRAPQQLTEALKVASARDLQSVSEFVRQTLIDKLREDGLLARGEHQGA